MKMIEKILVGAGQAVTAIRDFAVQMDFVEEPWEIPTIVYGPYDAIWPTVGGEGSAWFCMFCGRNGADFSKDEIALTGGETHGDVYHPGLKLTFTRLSLDPSESK